ncbi:YihY/virulence factor BrkB family protein [Methylocystis echinoides]|uniref:YihY/virulence factor BrkB family protein n=1 Tax=Methylocystis echinoides TaxID=29468 RepID=UPI003435EEEA
MAMDQASSSGRGAAGRGRDASTPAEIPASGWMDVLGRVYNNIAEHRVLAIAAGVTFYALLAIFPAIAAFVALYGLVADPATIAGHINALSGVLPAEGLSIVSDQIQRVSAQGSARLGAASIIGLLVSLWSANAGMKAIFDALNVVYQEREKRGFFRLNAVTLAFTLGGMAMIAMSLALVVAAPPALQALRLPPEAETAIALLRWPILLVLVALAISLVYRFGPSRDEPKWRWVSWGGAFAAIVWLAASLLFSWYAANIGKFNETYGSLGAAIGFMLWMWVSSIVLLIGAELNAEMEHQTAKDTTEGHPRPLGERGAVMADTVGRPSS